MKKVCIIILLALLMLSTFITVSAHSGRTDDNGGHYDTSTGEYHYHHGHPAHQHTNGKCPYDYDDNTNHSSNSSSDESWYVYAIGIPLVCIIIVLDYKVLDGRIFMFFMSLFFHIIMLPLYFVGVIQWIIDKIRNKEE